MMEEDDDGGEEEESNIDKQFKKGRKNEKTENTRRNKYDTEHE